MTDMVLAPRLRHAVLAAVAVAIAGSPVAAQDLAGPTPPGAPAPAVAADWAGTPAVLRPATERAPLGAEARDFVVTGRVISSDDRQPLPAVNVVVAGTTIGIATDVDGRYRITAPNETDSLRFSFIGFESQTVPILGRAEINVTLRPESYRGDEVVVIGYGTREVRDLTGSVGVVTAEDIEGKPLKSFEDALTGRVPGVQVQQNSGDLQGNFAINIRGVGSYNGSNRPLYVVDGIPLEATDVTFLASINTEDIESISVLKDASAASIYGTRAADGVVIITTKTGAGREPQISFSSELGTSGPVNQLEMLNSAQLADFLVESRRNQQALNGGTPTYVLPAPLQDPAFLAANDTDWQDAVTRDALTQRYNVSALGSSGALQFAASGNYENITGSLVATDLQKASLRLNAVAELSSKATVDVRLNGARQWGNVVVNDQIFGSSYRDALYKYPWELPRDANGNFPSYSSEDPEVDAIYSRAFAQNPVADLIQNERYRQFQQYVGNVALTYRLPYNTQYRGSASATLSNKRADDFFPVFSRPPQQREVIQVLSNDENGYNYFTDHTLTYDRAFGEHDLEVLGGFSYQTNYFTFSFINAGGGTNNGQRQITQQPTINAASGGRQQDQVLVSYFSRADYSYADKYFVTGTLRRDGASKFSPDQKWGLFPAIGLSWRVSNEPFMRSVGWVSDLKLRASLGQLGDRDGITDNVFLNLVGTGGVVAFGDVPVLQAPISNIASNVKWETVTQADLGLDAQFFRGRVGLTADVYNRQTDDILGRVPVPSALGVDFISANLGSVRNRGFEFGLNTTPVNGAGPADFSWRFDATFGYNENTVLDLGENVLGDAQSLPGRGLDGPLRGGSVNRTEVGRPIGEFWVWEFDGICQTSQYDPDARTCNGIANTDPGDTLYRDLNGDGVINDDDRSFQGSGLPKIFGGLTNAFSYGPLELETLFTYALGRKLLDTSLMFGLSGDSNINKRAEALDRWTPENQDTDIPRAIQGPRGYDNVRPSTFFLQNADFLRLRTLTLTYRLPDVLAGRVGARNARLSFIGTNLLTFTGYSGFDPEASSGRRTGSGNIDASSNPLSPGLDFVTFPLARTYALRLNVTL